jgi:undecaprenyl pyrophosphate synthase
MEEYLFEVAMVVFGFLVATSSFFGKRTLNNIEKNQSKHDKRIEEMEKQFLSYQLDHEVESKKNDDELVNTIINKMDSVQNEITKRIEVIESKSEKQIQRLWDEHNNLSKDFHEFKEHIAINYTEKDDFSSQTRDINKKLDNVYGQVSKIVGMLEQKGHANE